MLSGGYDESIRIFNLQKHAEAGEFRSPSNLGTPTCSSFAPPPVSSSPSTHALVGLTSGKIIVYRKKDWVVQHILSGHSEEKGGVSCIAVHPTGRMALSGGRGDGRIVLWDLTKGRLAFVHKLPSPGGGDTRKKMAGRDVEIGDIIWSHDGNRYAFCRGHRVTARDVTTGEDVLDVDLPSRANQLTFVGGVEGMFLAVACDDGSLPLLGVGSMGDEDGEEEGSNTRRAIMAIEPVDRLVAGEERFKCIKAVQGGSGFLVVTANSGGVISLMDLEGAARMMLMDQNDTNDREGEDKKDEGYSSEDEDEDEDVAVEILETVKIGSGAHITNIAVWSHDDPSSNTDHLSHNEDEADDQEETSDEEDELEECKDNDKNTKHANKQRNVKQKVPTGGRGNEIEMDAKALERARDLVSQAKKRQKDLNEITHVK